jgi:dihydrolipoamide dehydrogenase
MADYDFDVAVIGAGPGGYVAAIRAAQLGFKTVCIEKRKTLGGTCLNVGCIPSKALLQSTEHLDFIQHHALEHGIEGTESKADFTKMQTRKDKVVEGLVGGVAALFKRYGIERVEGSAAFVDSHRLDIKNGDQTSSLTAAKFILAMGSEPIELPFLPFDEKQVLSSTGALFLPKPPSKMLVIGAGVIGVELASVYKRLGTQIEVIEMLEKICPAMDDAISKNLLQVLKKQGLSFFLGAKVLKGKVDEKGVVLDVEYEGKPVQFKGDAVLVAVGRRPNAKGVGLEQIGIELSPKGFVPVNGNFQTAQPHIYAIGDIVDGVMLAHRASEEGIAVAEIMAGLHPHVNYLAVPNVIYTNPEVAAVGLTEQEAKELGRELLTATCQFRGNARARCMGDMEGLVKVIGDKATGRLLGMHIIGPHASELIGEGVMAMESKMTLEEIGRSSHAHPTLCEAIKEVCLLALSKPLHY